MKHRIWLSQIPVAALFAFFFYISEAGTQGNLKNTFLREKVFPGLRSLTGFFTNVKFRTRGPMPPKNPNIVVVDIDKYSIENYGRWPWHRDVTAKLIKKIIEADAKVVGIDITFSEPDQRVSPDLRKFLGSLNLEGTADVYETDRELENVFQEHADKIVLGWIAPGHCQPAYGWPDECGITQMVPMRFTDVPSTMPDAYEKFAYKKQLIPGDLDFTQSPLVNIFDAITNIDSYNSAAKHAGYFDVFADRDNFIRRTNLVLFGNGQAYPSLALETARVALGEELGIELNPDGRIESIKFLKSGREIPVSPVGAMEINFRGPGQTFQYISAAEVMKDEDEMQIERNREIASVSKASLLKDAIVFVGLSAVGVYDMRSFPFDENTPGVEGHATIADNLLANDMLVYGSSKAAAVVMFMLMSLGAVLFAFVTEKLQAVPALLLFVFAMSGIGFGDIQLFTSNQNWNTGLLYIEMALIFGLTMSMKYVREEKNKKFIRTAFSKYVAPAIVDSILKDPTKLTVGGIKRDLTILFSDIRGFTTFSEKLDAKLLAQFLNDYLGIMTDIVFDNEGTLDKYIGDAVMAFWGAPLDQPKHAANACVAAIKMQQALAQNHARFLQQYGVDVQVGIGINSGPVSVGNMGSERIFEYTVIGDHVNLASRLEGLTKYYGAKIVTSRFTFDMIHSTGEPLPPHRILDFVKVKGKKTAVELIQVLERDFDPEGLQLFEEGRALYLQRQWDAAIAKFQASGEKLRVGDQLDPTAQMYMERCEELKNSPPDADWDGAWEMTSK